MSPLVEWFFVWFMVIGLTLITLATVLLCIEFFHDIIKGKMP